MNAFVAVPMGFINTLGGLPTHPLVVHGLRDVDVSAGGVGYLAGDCESQTCAAGPAFPAVVLDDSVGAESRAKRTPPRPQRIWFREPSAASSWMRMDSWVWKVDITTGDGTEVEVLVEAGDASILAQETD